MTDLEEIIVLEMPPYYKGFHEGMRVAENLVLDLLKEERQQDYISYCAYLIIVLTRKFDEQLIKMLNEWEWEVKT